MSSAFNQSIRRPNTIDIVSKLKETNCNHCGQPDVEVITECKHFFHFKCLSYIYYYTNACLCNLPLQINKLKVINYNECDRCKNNFNLIKCEACFKMHCYHCLLTRPLAPCCSSLTKELDSKFDNCPGCLNTRSYLDFSIISCRTHPLLCKMCCNISADNRKCIIGCNINFYGGYFCKCSACDRIELEYFGEFACSNDCVVCRKCVDQYKLKRTIENKKTLDCLYCGHNLVAKSHSWKSN